MNDTSFARLEIVSYHLSTTVPPSYAVRKELVLPFSKTFEETFEESGFIRVPFVHPLGPEQRNWTMPLDLFRYPTKIIIRTPDVRILPSKSNSCIDVLILTPSMPKKLFLQLEWETLYNRRLPKVVTVDLDGNEVSTVDLNPHSSE